jgi:glutaredoxin 3
MSLAGPLIAANKVVVFAWVKCPYCVKVKALLDSVTKDVTYVYVDTVENGEAIREEIIKATGHETVPAVFINGKLIGGFSDTNALNEQGKLLELLA